MDYNIIAADEKIGQIQVAYKDGSGKTVGVYAMDVPIVDGAFITGDALHQEIVHRAPTWALTREQEVQAAIGFDQVAALVVAPSINEADAESEANSRMWEQTKFEQRVAAALVKFGVLQSDPTIIPVGNL